MLSCVSMPNIHSAPQLSVVGDTRMHTDARARAHTGSPVLASLMKGERERGAGREKEKGSLKPCLEKEKTG